MALKLLAVRPRTRAELGSSLRKHGIAGDVVDEVLDRYDEVGIIDDVAFAKAWVTSRHHGRGLARRALAGELRRKGVDDGTTREVLDELDPAEEEAAARELVRRKLRSLRRVDDQTATRRLVGMLARKGYPSGMAFSVVREELAAAGREEPEEPHSI